MERRGFLRAMLAAGMAPALVKAASLMPVRALPSGLLVPEQVSLIASGLSLGDVITIAGVTGPSGASKLFVVTGKTDGGVMTIALQGTSVVSAQENACTPIRSVAESVPSGQSSP